MTASDWQFSTPADKGVIFGTQLVLAPIAVIGVAGAAARRFDLPSLVVLVLIFGALIWMTMLAAKAAAFVRWSPEQVIVGVAPIWRTRLMRADIAEVAVVRIDAYADYGGWGIKGSARSERGRLYSVGGDSGVVIVMRDGRKFVVAFKNAKVPCRIRRSLSPLL